MSKKFTPRPYQKLIVDHILDEKRNGIYAGMGLGKTSSTLTALETLYLSGEQTLPTLIVAPLRVARSTWPDEANKWDHLRNIEVQPVVGNATERRAALRNTNASIFTTNYEQLPWLAEQFNGKWPFSNVVADESTKLKGFRLRKGTQRAKALAKYAHTAVDRFSELTGTPAPNGLTDLWAQAWFLDGGKRLGRSFTAFTQRWFRPNDNGFGVTPLPHAQEEIQNLLSDICLTIKAEDWFDLEEPIHNVVKVDIPSSARNLYRKMEKEMFMQIGEHEVEAFNAASRTIKCLQLCNGAAYVDESGAWKEVHDQKLKALEEVIEEASGMPVLVAYHFKSDLERLRKAFTKGRVLDTDPQTIRDWNAGKIPVLFAHPASAGHGLSLQDGGNIIVFFGLWWNLEEHMQIIERIGPTRQMQAGHDRNVFIHYIVARDTVDELVMARLETKQSVQEILLNAMRTTQ